MKINEFSGTKKVRVKCKHKIAEIADIKNPYHMSWGKQAVSSTPVKIFESFGGQSSLAIVPVHYIIKTIDMLWEMFTHKHFQIFDGPKEYKVLIAYA